MPDIPKIPCIENMVAKMGETMSESQARKMLDEAVARTKAIVAEQQIPEWAAADMVAKQMKQEQKLLAALKKRQVIQDAGARFQLEQIALSGKSTFGKSLQKFLQKVENIGNAIGGRHIAGFFSDLRERQALDGWLNKEHALPIMQELEQLNYQRLGMEHKVGFTGDKQSQAIAEVFFRRRLDIQAANNRWGAHTEEVPGYIFLQTHSADRLRRTGKKGKVFSPENINESFKAWRASLDTLKIDWGRTLAGEDRELFLRNFHDAIYTNIHGDPMEQGAELRKFKKPGGSLADKLSSQRVLWFADAESSFRYNEMWGTADVQQTILNTLKSGGRNTAMLQNLGTRPVDNIEAVRDKLLDQVKQQPNAQAQANDLRSRRIDGQIDLLTGKANSSVRPWLSHAVDVVKNITLAGKGGGIIISAFSDKAFLQSRMAYEGFSQLEAVALQAKTLFGINPDLAAEVGVFNQSLSGSMHNRFAEDIRAVGGTQKMVDWMMKYQGLNRWTAANQASAGAVVAHRLAKDSHLSWEKLPERRRQVLETYGFSPKEWEAVRTQKYNWDDDWSVITPDKMQELPDDLVATLLPEGQKATAGAIRRQKDLLEAKLDFYIGDAVHEAVPTPDAAVRSIRTLNGTQRGEWSREFAELLFVFKGFPIKAAMTMARQSSAIGGLSGTFHALTLVAQAGALGYLSGVAKDHLRGRTAKRLIEADGTLNGKVWIEAVARGGGLGIFGDLLLSDYDRRYRSALAIAAGPALGELDNVLSLAGRTRRVALGEEKVEGLGYEAFRTVESNLPLVGMFPVRSVMEYFVMMQLKEALSPGVFRRTKRSVENNNYQEYWIDPVH